MNVKNSTGRKQIERMSIGIAYGAILALITTMAFLALFALLLAKGIIAQSLMHPMSKIALVIGTVVGSMIAMRTAKQKALQSAIITAIAFYLVLLSITALFFDGQYSGAWGNAICVFVGVGISILPKFMLKRSHSSRVKKMRYR